MLGTEMQMNSMRRVLHHDGTPNGMHLLAGQWFCDGADNKQKKSQLNAQCSKQNTCNATMSSSHLHLHQLQLAP